MAVDYNFQKKLIIEVSEAELSWVHNQGYVWFHEIFIPALESVASSSLLPSEPLSSCYYTAGDVNDLNEAPNKALEYYLKALSFDPDCSATYREIASMLDKVGKFEQALKYSNKAIALDPDDIYAIRDREDRLWNDVPLYEEGDVFWNVCEHLANADPSKALAIVEDMNDVIGLRGKLYCYGALGESDKYLRTWSEFIQICDKMDINLADWFYMPDDIYESPEIWILLLSSQIEFSGFGGNIDSLHSNKTYCELTTNEKIRLSFQYEKHSNSKDYKALKLLSETYPEWVELREHFPP